MNYLFHRREHFRSKFRKVMRTRENWKILRLTIQNHLLRPERAAKNIRIWMSSINNFFRLSFLFLPLSLPFWLVTIYLGLTAKVRFLRIFLKPKSLWEFQGISKKFGENLHGFHEDFHWISRIYWKDVRSSPRQLEARSIESSALRSLHRLSPPPSLFPPISSEFHGWTGQSRGGALAGSDSASERFERRR